VSVEAIRVEESQSILQSIELPSCTYFQGFGRILAVIQVVEGIE
jgi:hypothetical protein